jgi:flagellar biosynthesis/type III secretory pathway protein FliH
MKKFLNIFKWRLRLVQKGYDLGWKHGHEAGMAENHKQIIDLLNKHIHDVDWLKEDPYTRKELVQVVRNHVPDKELVGWEK